MTDLDRIEDGQEVVDKLSSGSNLKVEDISDEYLSLFNDSVIDLIQNRIQSTLMAQIEENGQRVFYPCMFMVVTAVGEHNIPVAAEYLVNEINKIDDRGDLKGFLVPLATMQLAEMQGLRIIKPSPSKYSVFCFAHMRVNDEQARNPSVLGPMFVNEGGISEVVFKD